MSRSILGVVGGGVALLLSGCASFELVSNPAGAEVHEFGERVGSTPYAFEQFSGERTLTVKRDGFVERQVLVSSLDRKRVAVRLERVRTTVLHTVPTDVQVIRAADEVVMGRSSLKLPLVRPEKVVLRKEGYKPSPMTLVPNETYKVEMEPLEGFKAVTFVSKPSGAMISDRAVGDAIAHTPASISAEEGTEFEFVLEDYQPAYYMINKRSPSRVFVELIPVPTVTLLGAEGIAVYGAGGGEALGRLPYTIQIRDVRAFEVRREGFYPKTVTLSPESPVEVFVELEPIPLKRVQSQPAGAIISRIGKREVLGRAPLDLLADSERLVEVYMEGYVRRVIGFGPDSPADILVELQPVGQDVLVVDELQDSSISVF